MTDQKLKPCPFCGGEARIDKLYENEWYVYCPKCERHYDTEQEAIENWNARVVIQNDRIGRNIYANK